jgi:circadian clock protein KaiC
VLKMRFSAHDTTLREFAIAPPDGIRVMLPFESEEGLLAEVVQQRGESGHGLPGG